MTDEPIAKGDTVRLTEAAYRVQTPSVGFKNGEVLEVNDGRAVIDWLDQALPREVSVEDLEKVARKKPTAGWKNKTKGINVGDTVRYSQTWLQSTSTFTGDLPRAKGKVTAIKDLGGLQIATIDWGNPDIPERVNVANLSKVKVRGVADE
jgi:hypothetical protein